jgi:hypothetical protein
VLNAANSASNFVASARENSARSSGALYAEVSNQANWA